MRRVACETILPYVLQYGKRHWGSDSAAHKKDDDAAYAQAAIAQAVYDDFDDYLEMVIDFGYVTMFASAMPLSSTLTVLTNLAEVANDHFKLRYVTRRPMPHRVGTIPMVWFRLLSVMCWFAIVTNMPLTFV